MKDLSGLEFRVPYLYDKGFVLIRPVVDYQEQMFSHKDNDGILRHFYIPKLRELLMTAQNDNPYISLMHMEVHEDTAKKIVTQHGVTPNSILPVADKLYTQDTLPAGYICKFRDDTDLVVDGNHRYVYAFLRGFATMRFFVMQEPLWKKCLVKVPREIGEQLVR